MKKAFQATISVVGVILLWEACLRPLLTAPASGQATPKEKDSVELARLFAEDQADRSPKDAKAIDWTTVSARDRKRLARVKELYEAGKLLTGADHYHAAMILQHGGASADYLLAHELCVV